jgi:hypothetical protein
MKFNQEYTSQELNGITDSFQDAVDYVSDKVSDAALWATEATGTTQSALALTEDIDDQVNKLSAGYKAKIKEFQTMMAKALKSKNQVEEAIESLPDGPDKQRLMTRYEKNNGIFNQYILPVWEKFQNWAGGGGDFAGMGLLISGTMVVTAGATVTAITLGLPYMYMYFSENERILSDPALAKTYVSSRGLLNFGSIPWYIPVGVVSLGGIYLLSKFSK